MSGHSPISRDALDAMFQGIRTKTKWNLDGELLWGYYFTDAEESKLIVAARELARSGYRIVRIFEASDKGVSLGYLYLHVEKIEAHSVDSLDQRNSNLATFALAHGLRSYDGMDVGPAPPPSAGSSD
jgi:hypothetical protein